MVLKIVIIGLILLGLIVPGSSASAALRSCRTDPILTFSDGSILTVTATIATDETNVSRVVYTVHVPAGLTLVRTVYTANGLGQKEAVVVIADGKPGIYNSDTVVTTQRGIVQVKAVSSLNPGTFGSASGTSGEHLLVTLTQANRPGTDSWTNPDGALTMAVK